MVSEAMIVFVTIRVPLICSLLNFRAACSGLTAWVIVPFVML